MPYVLLSRIGAAIPTVLGVMVIIFVTRRLLPGDPIAVILGGADATPETIANLRQQFGLDKPLLEQFWIFFTDALTLNFGTSYATRQPVSATIAQQLPHTLQLALAAAAVSAVVGILLGVLAAIRRGGPADALIRVLSLINTSMPSFWLGLILIMVFAFGLGWFPATGSGTPAQLVLPAITLGLSAAGTVTRVVRNSVIEVLGENYVTALYAKGLRRRVVVGTHVLRNAVIPTVTVVGLQLGALLAGAVIVETVFSRQGIGQSLVQAINGQDYPMVQGIVLVIACLYVIINLVVDISYAYIDPRVRAVVGKA
ncbi:ABC transporter permease [Microbacterium sediminis]|uniref:Peptide ABC transporter permease n=1 Tax=Microbacterium sediminis TaxID=904291 RepID=A0A1B9NIK2_9MICO|nr:ABC transporter permease [Microbacterium sediminis]OCG76439.1 peptide ABC transporter permease [Microbacterium sediminis]